MNSKTELCEKDKIKKTISEFVLIHPFKSNLGGVYKSSIEGNELIITLRENGLFSLKIKNVAGKLFQTPTLSSDSLLDAIEVSKEVSISFLKPQLRKTIPVNEEGSNPSKEEGGPASLITPFIATVRKQLSYKPILSSYGGLLIAKCKECNDSGKTTYAVLFKNKGLRYEGCPTCNKLKEIKPELKRVN